MKETSPSVLCGRCGSIMEIESRKPATSWHKAYNIYKCPHCKSYAAVDIGDEICPYCFSACYHIAGMEEGSRMCVNPACTGFKLEIWGEDLEITWNYDRCFTYWGKYDSLHGWTDPVHYKLEDFYRQIIKQHKLPKYFYGYRGIFSLTYKLWKKKYGEYYLRGGL